MAWLTQRLAVNVEKLFLSKGREIRLSSLVLLIMVALLVFVGPVFPAQLQKTINSAGFTIIILAAVLSLNKFRSQMFYLAIISIIGEWFIQYIDLKILFVISDLINFVFFIIVVILFISQLVQSSKIGVLQIYEAINGYLLLGIVFSILIAIIDKKIPGAFAFPEPPVEFGSYMYYGFVTLSTLGYGEIVPKIPVAKSLAILTTISGQFYIATIIAIIISKYQPGNSKKNKP